MQTEKDASRIYGQLCKSDTSVVEPSPKVDAFFEELSRLHPDLNDLPDDDADNSPWSCGFDKSAGHLIVSCRWSRADEIAELIENLAEKHKLVFYDPQSDEVTSF